MHRLGSLVVLSFCGAAIVAPASIGSERRGAAIGVPSAGPGPCHVHAPVLLTAGRAPRARIRLDLAAGATRTGTALETDRVASRTHLADGTIRPVSALETYRLAYRTGALSGTRLPVHLRITVTNVGSNVAPRTVAVAGFIDALDGGEVSAAGSSTITVNDHLPPQAIGVGARWRVVNCDTVGSDPARETRTYTLRSVANRIMLASFSDVIELDPANVDLGSLKVGGTSVHLRLTTLHGSATGRWRVPLANPFGETRRTVSSYETIARGTGKGLPVSSIRVDYVDTDVQPAAK